MDLKTLEYLEQRAKKGRNIVKLIEALFGLKKDLENTKCADFYIERGYHRFEAKDDSVKGRILAKMIVLAQEEIDAEIARLEQELAEL
jgi:hypothetical protein